MNCLKNHWKALALLTALVLWAAWYSRPVDIYTVAPGTKEPDMMDLTLSNLGENHKDYPLKNLTPEDPEWGPALKAVEALRFRRPPWNAVLQFIPDHRTTGRATQDGDHHVMFFLGRRTKGYIQVQFFIDEWMYHSPHSNRNLTLWVKNSRESGDALAEVLRPLLNET